LPEQYLKSLPSLSWTFSKESLKSSNSLIFLYKIVLELPRKFLSFGNLPPYFILSIKISLSFPRLLKRKERGALKKKFKA